MPLLCTKDVPFFIWEWNLGPILAGIFIVELETTVVPTLGNLLHKWKRYVDDIYSLLVETDTANEILLKPNSFHINIQFRYKAETNNSLSFLDVMVIRKNSSIETVYRKPESAKSRAWRTRVLCMFTCLRAHVLCVLACFCAWRAWRVYVVSMLACLRAWCACVHVCVVVTMKCFIFLRVWCLVCFFFLFALHFNTLI